MRDMTAGYYESRAEQATPLEGEVEVCDLCGSELCQHFNCINRECLNADCERCLPVEVIANV